jgi:hypothetical protein
VQLAVGIAHDEHQGAPKTTGVKGCYMKHVWKPKKGRGVKVITKLMKKSAMKKSASKTKASHVEDYP